MTLDATRASYEPHQPAFIKWVDDKKQQLGKAASDFVLWAADHRALQVPAVAPISWPNVDERLSLIQELLE
jgi:hypothetical protein